LSHIGDMGILVLLLPQIHEVISDNGVTDALKKKPKFSLNLKGSFRYCSFENMDAPGTHFFVTASQKNLTASKFLNAQFFSSRFFNIC